MASKNRRKPGFFGGEARTDSSDTTVSVLKFPGPSYWRSWILIGWLRLAALLPWRWSLKLHQRFGRFIGRRSRRAGRAVRENLEISVAIKDYAPRYALMYNKRRSRLLSEYQRRCRERYADESFQKRDIRGMLRSLRNNAVVWFMGDEAHTGKSSALLPLFYCRKRDDSGYSFRPAARSFRATTSLPIPSV